MTEQTHLPATDVQFFEAHLPVGGERLSVRLQCTASTPVRERSALVSVAFYADEKLLPPVGDLAVNPTIGSYAYLNIAEHPEASETDVAVEVPTGATSVAIRGHLWKQGTSATVRITDVEFTPSADGQADEPWNIASDDPLIVLYTTAPPMGHQTLGLRPNRLAREYARLGIQVVFFPFSSLQGQPTRVGPKIVQFPQDDFHRVMDHLATRKGPQNVFVCSSFPDIRATTAIDTLRMSGWHIMYEVRDDMEEFHRVGYSKWYRPALERRVARVADTIVAVSPRLATKMDILVGAPGVADVIPNAVADEFVEATKNLRTTSTMRTRLSGPKVVGYIGHLTPAWFDWPLIVDAARKMPDVSFEIIGHGAPTRLPSLRNLHILGPRDHDEFVEICQHWRVGVIPFKPSTLTRAVDPNKVYEYLAVGLRVVTARMGAVTDCPSTYIYDDSVEFVPTLHEALTTPMHGSELSDIDDFVQASRWSSRARAIATKAGLP